MNYFSIWIRRKKITKNKKMKRKIYKRPMKKRKKSLTRSLSSQM